MIMRILLLFSWMFMLLCFGFMAIAVVKRLRIDQMKYRQNLTEIAQQHVKDLDRLRSALAEAERKREDAIVAVDLKDKELIFERGRRAQAERERGEAICSSDACCDSYATENQRLSDRAERAEADLAAARETIRKLRSAENMTCVWHITDAFLGRTEKK